MSHQPTAADILRVVPREKLDSPVSDLHVAQLADIIKTWEDYVPFFEITEAEEEEIHQNHQHNYRNQKREAIRKWKHKFGGNATYRRLIIILCGAQHVDTADKVREMLLPKTNDTATPKSYLESFREYLVECYTETQHPSRSQWPFSSMSSYIDLTLTEVPPIPQLHSHMGEQPEAHQRKSVELSELFNTGSHYSRQAKRKVILLEGGAGSGKTTLTWHACQKWAEGKLFQQFSHLIHLSLEDPDLVSARSLADIIPHPSSEVREGIAKEIAEQNGKGVCFLLDGWDEASPILRHRDSFIPRFIAGKTGKMLPRCSIVMTSRPVAAGSLYPLLTSRVTIGGFSSKQIEEFIDESLGQNSDDKRELMKGFEQNPRLAGLCNLPVNIAIAVHLFCSSGHQLPSTRTEIFESFVQNLLLRHMQQRTEHEVVEVKDFHHLPADISQRFDSISSLAFHSIMEGRRLCGPLDLEKLGIISQVGTLGLMQVHPQLTRFGMDSRYSFLHYAMQEFLAAYHISKMTDEEQTEMAREILHTNPLSPVLPFYAGLTKLSNVHIRNTLLEVTRRPLDADTVVEDMHKQPDRLSSDRRRLLLALLNCVYESQDTRMCTSIKPPISPKLNEFFPNFVFISFFHLGLDPMDCLSLGYFLANKCLQESLFVDLMHCHIGDIGTEVLMKQLKQLNIKPPRVPPLWIELSCNSLTQTGMKFVSEVLGQSLLIRALLLADCWKVGMTIQDRHQGLEHLIKGLSQSSCTFVNLRHNSLSEEHVQQIMISCHHLTYFNMSDNVIENPPVKIAEALKRNTSLKLMFMRNCNITDEVLLLLGKALQSNKSLEQLDVKNNPFSSSAITKFLELFITSDSGLTTLHFSHTLTDAQTRLVTMITFFRAVAGRRSILTVNPTLPVDDMYHYSSMRALLSLPEELQSRLQLPRDV